MSPTLVSARLREFIIERAAGRCEYCLLHQDDTPLTHQADHIIPLKHGGQTTAENLALACLDAIPRVRPEDCFVAHDAPRNDAFEKPTA
jgi:hypothetical protein